MNRTYLITQEQFKDVQHYKDMFAYQAGVIQELCSQERDDVVYGFELGRIHETLKKFQFEMVELIDDIEKQKVINEC